MRRGPGREWQPLHAHSATALVTYSQVFLFTRHSRHAGTSQPRPGFLVRALGAYHSLFLHG